MTSDYFKTISSTKTFENGKLVNDINIIMQNNGLDDLDILVNDNGDQKYYSMSQEEAIKNLIQINNNKDDLCEILENEDKLLASQYSKNYNKTQKKRKIIKKKKKDNSIKDSKSSLKSRKSKKSKKSKNKEEIELIDMII